MSTMLVLTYPGNSPTLCTILGSKSLHVGTTTFLITFLLLSIFLFYFHYCPLRSAEAFLLYRSVPRRGASTCIVCDAEYGTTRHLSFFLSFSPSSTFSTKPSFYFHSYNFFLSFFSFVLYIMRKEDFLSFSLSSISSSFF